MYLSKYDYLIINIIKYRSRLLINRLLRLCIGPIKAKSGKLLTPQDELINLTYY